MKKIIFCIILSLIFTCDSDQFNAQSVYKFRNYTINDGLSQSSVTSIIQDNIGSLWVGTQDGLNRFDGYSFQTYSSESTPGLENEYILSSFEGKDGVLWFGSANGLISYTQDKEVFKTYHLPTSDLLSVTDIDEDADGNIWFSSASIGLWKLDRKTEKMECLNSKIPSQKVISIHIRDRGILLGFEDYETVFLDITVLTFRKLHNDLGVKTIGVKTIASYGYNSYFLANNEGVYFYDASTNEVQLFEPLGFSEIGKIVVTDILVEDQRKLYLSTLNKGLLTLSRGSKGWIVAQTEQDLFQRNALLSNEINCVHKDRNGVVWLGTQRGLGGFDPIRTGFLGVGISADYSKGLPSQNVWCFEEATDGESMLIGTDNAVSRRYLKTGKFVHYFKQNNSKEYGIDNSFLCLKAIRKNEYLAGSTDGLYKLTIDDKNPKNYTYSPIKVGTKQTNIDRVYTIRYWKENRYWIGAKNGVYLYDINKGILAFFEHNPQNKRTTIGSGSVRSIFQDRNNKIYFATAVGGLYQLEEEGGTLNIIQSKYHQTILNNTSDFITSILENDGYLWLGTLGSGLLKINTRTGELKSYSKKEGMPNGVVYGILEDKNDNLWVSTNKGLVKFNVEYERFTAYTETNGLLSNEFNLGASFESSNGVMYFGCISGFNYFTPSALEVKNKQLIINFSKLTVDGKTVKPISQNSIIKESISYITEITLPYKQRSFGLKFMTDEIHDPELVTYKYKLEGSEEGDVELGGNNEIRFSSLEPGTYKLLVYAKYENGSWSQNPATLTIIIQAPFWMRWWFWMIVSVIGLMLTLIYIRNRIRRERRTQVLLEMRIAQKTKEIRAQVEEIELKNKELAKTSTDLQKERDKSERLLRNVLPESMAMELKNEKKTKARPFKEVSVMFTDFVGFSSKAENMTADELVDKLDYYFTEFDTIIERNNLEKIKTIGDAYMCAGGVPVRNKTHAMETVLAGLQIQAFMRVLKNEAVINKTEFWELRLGINTGPVSAGVIGTKRFAYDIWGKTVNHAERMERLGEMGKVNISGDTYEFIAPYFECTYKGQVQSKSKGYLDIYTVERLKVELSRDAEGLYPNERYHKIVNLHLYSTIQYTKAEMHILRVLEDGLSEDLLYHSIGHTKDVTRMAERIALLEEVNDEELFLLKSAATYHDAGFVRQYDHNEPEGAKMAEEILPLYGYTTENIDRIKELIYVTQIPHAPKNKLEEIICDADLDYLGRDDFFEIADKLRVELRQHGKINSDRAWDEMQVKFMTMHRYFTKTSIETRQPKKEQNLATVKAKLNKGEYID